MVFLGEDHGSRRIQTLKHRGEVIGSRVRVRVKKNKVAPPFREAEFDIMYAEGISRVGDILDLGVEHQIIEKRGSYYRYQDNLIGQGRENAKEFLRANPDLALAIENQIRETAGLRPSSADEAILDSDPAAAQA